MQRATHPDFLLLAEHLTDVVTRHGKDFRCTYANPAIERYMHLPPKAFIGKTYRELHFPEDLCSFFDRELSEVFASRGAKETKYELPTGEYIQARMVPELDENGEVNSVFIISREVPEQRKLEQDDFIQKHLLESVTQHTEMALFLMDEQQVCIYMNEAAEKLTGFRLHELKGKSLHYHIHHTRPDGSSYPLHECPIDRALAELRKVKGEEVFVHKDGSFYPVAFTASPMLINGKLTGTAIEVRNTSEEKAAEEERLSHDVKFRNFSDSITTLAWMANPSGGIFWFNQRWYEYTGRHLADMQGNGWERVLDPAHMQRVIKFIRNAWQEGKPWELSFPMRRYDGKYRWFLTRAVPIKDNNGKLQRWIGTNTDVHEQWLAEQKLKESEAHFRTLAESMPQLVWVAQADGAVTYYNNKVSDFAGARRMENGAWHWEGMLHPDDVAKTEKAWAEAVHNGTEYSVEHQAQMADGSYRWYLSRAVPLKDNQGNVSNWFGTATDIHEQKMQEQLLEQKVYERTRELELLNTALQSSNKELEQFAYVASHDLQEPLRKIKAFGTMLTNGYKEQLGERGIDLINRMQRASERMGTLIDDLLSFSRVASKKEIFQSVDLNELLLDLLQDFDVAIREQQATIQLTTLSTVHGSPFQLRQLFQNLLSNALKFRKPNTPPVVHISSESILGAALPKHLGAPKHKKYQLIRVSDNGIGFEQEYAERIFQIFQRLHGRTEYPGSGIGLAIVQKVVANHAGYVTASSTPHAGASFEVTLPL